MDGITIIPAQAAHAPFLGRCVARAIGDDLCRQLAGSTDQAADAFATLAARTDTQYSYRNALVALGHDGTPVGGCIFYDGALLHQLRQPAADLLRNEFGFDITSGGDETGPGEIYLDTLYIEPAYRRRGLARNLIARVVDQASGAGLPAGLLVDHDNTNARHLYTSCGFTIVGDRPFAGTAMHHMQTKAL